VETQEWGVFSRGEKQQVWEWLTVNRPEKEKKRGVTKTHGTRRRKGNKKVCGRKREEETPAEKNGKDRQKKDLPSRCVKREEAKKHPGKDKSVRDITLPNEIGQGEKKGVGKLLKKEEKVNPGLASEFPGKGCPEREGRKMPSLVESPMRGVEKKNMGQKAKGLAAKSQWKTATDHRKKQSQRSVGTERDIWKARREAGNRKTEKSFKRRNVSITKGKSVRTGTFRGGDLYGPMRRTIWEKSKKKDKVDERNEKHRHPYTAGGERKKDKKNKKKVITSATHAKIGKRLKKGVQGGRV